MSAIGIGGPSSLGDLHGAGLLVPALQPEILPLREVKPAPCTQACPAGIQVKAYVSLIAEERFAEALEVIRRRCPLPGICGRVCDHPCELACRRDRVDDPIAIRALKRFVADQERDFGLPAPPPGPTRPHKVAVIGSGPAGLTAAYDLRLDGFPVTVFEGENDPGGMMRYGITAYRLPRDILDAEIDVIVRAGVEIRTGMRLGENLDLEQLRYEGYEAVLLAVGAQIGRHLGLADEDDVPEIEDALAFLRRVNAGDHSPVPRRVIVIGGGSTAVETARAARRLGAKSVEILYRRSQKELLAGPEEVKAAEAEGIRFRFLVAPSKVWREDDRFRGLECVNVGLGHEDKSGRPRPIVIPGSEFLVDADKIFAAVGQDVDLGFLPARGRTKLVDKGKLWIDPDTATTRLTGVFAAGDMVTGPATVIEAIAGGHSAAESIRHFIEEGRAAIREQRPERRAPVEYELPDATPLEAMRIDPTTLPIRRGKEFREVEQAYTARDAVAEARRCLRCGACGECRVCASSCQRRHVIVRTPRHEHVPSASVLVRAPAAMALSLDIHQPAPGRLLEHAQNRTLLDVDPHEGLDVELLPMRSRIQAEACRGCGTCIEVCPFHAITRSENGRGPQARIEPALCRGCNLCVGVCPTYAAISSTLSPEWWGEKVEDALLHGSIPMSSSRYVVLACQRRAGALEESVDDAGMHVEVVRLRCVGQLQAGMLLELARHGARGVLVAGCHEDRCRFGAGARLAADQVEQARRTLRHLGLDPGILVTDQSPNRAFDRLEDPITRLVRGAPRRDLAQVTVSREEDADEL